MTAMSKKRKKKEKVVSFWEEEIRGDTAELVTNKRSPGFQEKIEGWHPQLPPRVSPTLVTPLRIARLNSHDTREWRGLTVVQVSKQGYVSITSWQHLTSWHFMTPARHTKSFSYYYFKYFRHVVMLQKFSGPLVGPPFCVWGAVRPNMLNMPKSASVYGIRV